MSARKIRGDYGRLCQIAKTFDQQAAAVRQAFQNLKRQKEALENGQWVGQNASAFYQEMNASVLPALNRVVNGLEAAQKATDQISQVVKQAETEAAALFKLDGAPNTLTQMVKEAKAQPPTQGTKDSDPPPGDRPGNDPNTNRYEVTLDADGINWLKDKQTGATRAVNGAEVIRKLMASGTEADAQKAIDLAIKVYHVDVSNAKGVVYDPAKVDYLYAYALYEHLDKKIHVGSAALDLAWSSPGELASTLGHEAKHGDQDAEGRAPVRVDENGNISFFSAERQNLNELEAWQWELDHAKEHGLTQAEIDELQNGRDKYYNLLSEETKAQVDQGIYTLAPGQTGGRPLDKERSSEQP